MSKRNNCVLPNLSDKMKSKIDAYLEQVDVKRHHSGMCGGGGCGGGGGGCGGGRRLSNSYKKGKR